MRGKRVSEFLVALAVVALGAFIYRSQPASITVNGVKLGDGRERIDKVLGVPTFGMHDGVYPGDYHDYEGGVKVAFTEDSTVLLVYGTKVECEGVPLFQSGDAFQHARETLSGDFQATGVDDGGRQRYYSDFYNMIIWVTPAGTVYSVVMAGDSIPMTKQRLPAAKL